MLQGASHVDATFCRLWYNTSHASRARIIKYSEQNQMVEA